MGFDSDTALRLVAEALGLVDRFGAEAIDVRDLRMSDRTLVVEITARSTDSTRVRAEIVGVMGALSGLDVPGLFPVLQPQYYGVRAYDSAGEELLWVISSIDAARFAAEGRPVEWLANSIVQENTPEYRRSQADRTIGQVETSLRALVHLHGLEHAGEEYAERLWTASELSSLRKRAAAEGSDSADPQILLDYLFLPQLRRAIVEHRDWFNDGCVPDSDRLGESIDALNRVRRKVAHHREVSSEELEILENAARTALTAIGAAHPQIASDFVVDRWEDEVGRVFDEMKDGFDTDEPPPAGSIPERDRQALAAEALKAQKEAVAAALTALGHLVVPAVRRSLHEAVVDALSDWHAALGELTAVARLDDLTVQQAALAAERYDEALGRMRDVRREIEQLRRSAPS